MSHSASRSCESDLTIEFHPPERNRPKAITVYAGCSSCCCCCFHTVGGLIGAAIGSRMAPKNGIEEIPPSANPYYWLSLLVVSVLGMAILGFYSTEDFWVILLGGAAMGLPALQLIASGIALIAILMTSEGYRRAVMLIHLGKITLWTVIGTVIGIGLLIILGLTFFG